MNIRVLFLVLFGFILSSCTLFEVRRLPSDQKFEAGKTELNTKDQGIRWGVFQQGSLIPEYTQTTKAEFAATEEDAQNLLNERKKKLLSLIKQKYQFEPKTPGHFLLGSVVLIVAPVIDLTLVPLMYSLDYINVESQKAARASGKSKADATFVGLNDERLALIWFPMTRITFRELVYGPTSWMSFSGIPEPKKQWLNNPAAQAQLKNLMTSFSENKTHAS